MLTRNGGVCAGEMNDMFTLFKEDEFDGVLEEEIGGHFIDSDWKLCPDCNIKMQPMESSYQCTRCGRNKITFGMSTGFCTSIIDNYNTNNLCSMSIKITGKDSYPYHRALLRTVSDYSKTQSNNTIKQLNWFNSQSTDSKLPMVILKEAAELYNKIQKCNVVRRGNGRKGALGACIYFICNRHDITKKPKEIARFLSIEESQLSRGDKLLRQMHSNGKISIPIHHDPTSAYIRQYFESLELDDKYKPFILDVVTRASQVDMIGENNSRISTKCAGTIYALSQQMDLKITKSDIVKYCKISKSTFIRYYEFLIRNRRALKKIFKKYNIKPLKKKHKRAVLTTA